MIELLNAEKRFVVYRRSFWKAPQEIQALQDVSVSIKSGDRIGLMGPNGAGKTTLLKVLGQLLDLDGGSRIMNCHPLPLLDPCAGVHPDLSGLENLRFLARLYGFTGDELKKVLPRMEAACGLSHKDLSRPVSGYSLGMRLRIGLSPCFFVPCDVLLLDEGLGAGDEEFQNVVKHWFSLKMGDSCALVLASHSRDLIQSHCQRVLHLEQGRIVGEEDL